LEFRNWNFTYNLINKYNMATITAADVNKLRTATGAGMDCKKALVEADGDFDLAIENLRKRTKVAANRSDRESTESCDCCCKC
jgi:elongation factor Ts